MCGVVLVELDVGEVHLQDGRAGVPDPEEHQLGFSQVHRRQGRRVNITVMEKSYSSFCNILVHNIKSSDVQHEVWCR